ncbi:hypothetical protein G6F24_014032 [Rhizopus arrhizus]|nr:hypothetical protein G6F24_014032 [Rhizopus arrhizus]
MQLSGGRVTEAQRGMHAQLAHITGRAVRVQIAGGRTEDETKPAQPPRGQAGIGQRTAAYHCVEAFADHIADAVIEIQFQLHLRIALLETGQHRQQEAIADGRQPDAQQPTGRVLSLRQVRLCFGKLVQGTPAALQEQIALIGEVYAAGGAMEQARAQVLLEAGDALAHRRRGQAEDAGGTDDAARLRSRNQRPSSQFLINNGLSIINTPDGWRPAWPRFRCSSCLSVRSSAGRCLPSAWPRWRCRCPSRPARSRCRCWPVPRRRHPLRWPG